MGLKRSERPSAGTSRVRRGERFPEPDTSMERRTMMRRILGLAAVAAVALLLANDSAEAGLRRARKNMCCSHSHSSCCHTSCAAPCQPACAAPCGSCAPACAAPCGSCAPACAAPCGGSPCGACGACDGGHPTYSPGPGPGAGPGAGPQPQDAPLPPREDIPQGNAPQPTT